jgi:hypothetical protein
MRTTCWDILDKVWQLRMFRKAANSRIAERRTNPQVRLKNGPERGSSIYTAFPNASLDAGRLASLELRIEQYQSGDLRCWT